MRMPGRSPRSGSSRTPPCVGRARSHPVLLTVPFCFGRRRSPPSCPSCLATVIPPTSKRTPRTSGTRPLRCPPKTWKSSRISEDGSPPLGRYATASGYRRSEADRIPRRPGTVDRVRLPSPVGTRATEQTERVHPGVSLTNSPGGVAQGVWGAWRRQRHLQDVNPQTSVSARAESERKEDP